MGNSDYPVDKDEGAQVALGSVRADVSTLNKNVACAAVHNIRSIGYEKPKI